MDELFDQELGQAMLEEALRGREIKVEQWLLTDIFAALVETYDDKQLTELAEKLHCADLAQARKLIRETVPRVLQHYPRVLRALAIAAGARTPHIEMSHVKGEGKQMGGLPEFTMISEERRITLIQQFQEEFSALLQEYIPFEVGVAFTGTPVSLVLLDLVRGYFRGRFSVEPFFPRLAQEPVEGFDAYREQIRAFYGLDPLEGPAIDDAQASGWRILVTAVGGELSKELVSAFKRSKIKILPVLNAWTLDDVLSYVDLQNLTILPALLGDPPQAEKPHDAAKVEIDLRDWSCDKRGLYRHKGRMVKQDTVPDEVRELLALEETLRQAEEESNGGVADV